jgi:site-specific DNA-methyltransferase (adenine-specific)
MELYHDNFQNYKRYNIPKAQLVIADIPYNLGVNAYASSTEWYIDGDNKKGESNKAGKQFFNSDSNFNLVEYMHFCSKLLIKEPKETNKAPAMIVFCAFDQMQMLIDTGKRYGFNHGFPLFFIKNYSPQVLKANMKIVGATEHAVVLTREEREKETLIIDGTEHAVVLYRDKLPKFNNDGKMIFNWMWWEKDTTTPKIHPNQKPVPLLKKLIEIFTDVGDIVIDPCAGSGTTLLAAEQLGRKAYGFEIYKKFVDDFYNILAKDVQRSIFNIALDQQQADKRKLAGG